MRRKRFCYAYAGLVAGVVAQLFAATTRRAPKPM